MGKQLVNLSLEAASRVHLFCNLQGQVRTPGLVNYKKGALDSQPQVINLPVVCPLSVVLSGYSASSTTKTGHHDMAEILLKVMLNTMV
jgi:hypothetical protein